MYRIEYVEIDNKKPFEDFVSSLMVSERAKVFEKLVHFLEIKNRNLLSNDNLSKHLKDGIFELKILLKDKTSRTLFYYVKGQRIIITHGFIKKVQKTPNKEIEKAKILRFEYNKRMKYDQL